MSPDPAVVEYFAALYARVDAAIAVPIVKVTYGDGTEPQLSDYHENVAKWCRETPGASAVPSWLVEPYEYFTGHYRFVAHTIVVIADGELFDLTPPHEGRERRFLHHAPGGLAFEDARRDRAELPYPPFPR